MKTSVGHILNYSQDVVSAWGQAYGVLTGFTGDSVIHQSLVLSLLAEHT